MHTKILINRKVTNRRHSSGYYINKTALSYLVLVKNDVEHFRWTLRQLLRSNHLYVEVTTLRLAPGLY